MKMRSLQLFVAFIIALGLATVAATSAGAEQLPDETWSFDFEPRIIDHDQTTGITVVESGIANTEARTLYGIALDGSVAWSLPYAPDATISVHGLVVGDGVFYLASGLITGASNIQAVSTASGTLIDEWEVGGQARGLRLNDLLWFTYSEYVNSVWTDSTIATLEPTTGALSLSVVSGPTDVTLIDVANDGSFVLGGVPNETVRWDLTGATPIETHRIPAAPLTISADDSNIFAPGSAQLDILDAANLQSVRSVRGLRNDFGTIHELDDGRLVSIRKGRRSEPLVLLLGAAPGHEILGRGLSNRSSASGSATMIGNRVAFTDAPSQEIRLRNLTPTLDLSDIGTIEAGQSVSVVMRGDFLATVDSVRINGTPLAHTVVPGQDPPDEFMHSAIISLDARVFAAGSKTITVNSGLGTASATFEVEPAQRRRHFEMTVRPGSVDAEAEVTVACHDPDVVGVLADVNISAILSAETTITAEPVVGHECEVRALRVDAIGDGRDDHYTLGFYNPANDRTGTSSVDLDTSPLKFTMPARSVGVSVFLPGFDEQVLWTYAFGAGTPGLDRPTARLSCPNSSDNVSYPLYYGNWVRTMVPRNSPCELIHRTPTESTFTGFGFYEPQDGRFRPPTQPRETTYYGSHQATSLVVIYDIYPHPSEEDGAYVRQQYLDFLGRDGDLGGLRFWEQSLTSGQRQRSDLVRQFLNSPEFGGTVAPVNRLYSAYFDRSPDRVGLFFWVNWIRGGRSLSQVSDQFAASAEFTRTYGALSDSAFIDLVYRNVLGRAPDPGGFAYWNDRIADGLTRGQLMVNFSESAEYVEQTRAAVLVESLYQGLLQRSPDPGGFAYWTGVVESGAPVDSLINGMLSSNEYYNRFDEIYQRPPSGPARLEHLRPSE